MAKPQTFILLGLMTLFFMLFGLIAQQDLITGGAIGFGVANMFFIIMEA